MNETPPASDSSQFRPAASDAAAILLVHQGGRITHANQAAHALWQAESGELPGELFTNLFAPLESSPSGDAQPDLWLLIVGAWLNGNVALRINRRGKARSLDEKPVQVTVRVEKLADIIFVATVHPVVEAVAAPAPAQIPHTPAPPPPLPPVSPAECGLAPLLEHGAIGFFDLDAKTGRATYSSTWKRMLGILDTEFSDTIDAWRALIHPDDSGAAPDQIGKRTSTAPRPFNVEFRMRHHAGHWIWVQSVGVQLLSAGGELERVLGLNLDISERKEIEEATLAGDERLELLGSSTLGLFDLDFSHQTFWFSPGWRTILGYRENELTDELATFLASLPPDERSTGVEAWIRARSPDLSNFVNRELLMGKDGDRVPVLFGMHQVLTRKRELTRVVGFISPVSTTSDSEILPPALVQQALAASAEAIIVTNASGKIMFINPAATRMLRVRPEDVQDQLASQVFRLVQRDSGLPSDDPVARAISELNSLPQLTDSALPPINPGDAPRPIIWTARVVRDANSLVQGVIILFRDPGEISLTPDELLKANRLESLGMVAGGIAHDFNDLLTTILGGISVAKEKHASATLEESEKACLAAKGLTKQLLAFAKGGSISHTVMSAEDVLTASIKLAAAGSDVAITTEVAEGTEAVRVDRLQIAQVFQNLILNALQAMPPAPHRPQIQLRAANATLAENQIPPLAAGPYVEFEVRDNANGIVPENLEKIFEPFFTTRKHGTGLGLATALSIVRKHGGQIGVVSTLGQGTAFTVFLPRADSPITPHAQKAPSLRFRTGRILFMDDDPKIAGLTATMLQSLDYKFDIAKDGTEAVQLYERYFNVGRPYDAVILDVTVVGGMGGEECFKRLRDCDPEVRAIISSGYDNDSTARSFLDQGFCGYLTKPYRVADLGKVLKAVLG